jgi:Tol biopolymer transport system component
MSTDRFSRVERGLPGLFADLADARTPDYLEAAIERASDRPQRPSWTFPERWLPVELVSTRVPTTRMPWRQLGVVAVIALLLATLLAVYVGSHTPRLPAPFGPAGNGLIPFGRDGDIYVGNPTTGAIRPLVQSPEKETGPVVSRDGTKVAFARDVAGTTLTDMYVIGIDGSNLHKVTPSAIAKLHWGEWTPDGRLALIHDIDEANADCLSDRCTVSHLDLVDTDGSGRSVTVAAEPRLDYVRFRPPVGDQLLYRALVRDQWGLFAMDTDGNNVRVLVPATIPAQMDATFGTATYSADGSRVFYDAYTTDASFGDAGCCQLFVVNADGSNLHKFVSSAIGVWDGEAAVSPDGTLVAFWHNLPGQANRVTVIRADGSGQPIATGPELPGGAHWVWAPDSSKILMFPNDAETGKAYLLDPAGGPWTTVPWISDPDIDWQRLAN